MAYKSYLTQKYEHTHENSFYRVFSNQLLKKFQEEEGLHILIGNVLCNGHQIDAIFISKGKIIVIDFKNYGGNLTFSENNPWQISNGDDFVFVKGGGGIRNPYQQVNAYRFSLIQFIKNREQEIFQANHTNINLSHISTLVLFQQPIKYNTNTIPQLIQKYFFISDNNTCLSTIIDINSNKLNLTDFEINKILSVLNITEDNLYFDSKLHEIEEESNTSNAIERLEQVRKELSKVNHTNKTEVEKLILYYQTLISLERIKEPTINEIHSFYINWSNITNSLKINLELSPSFHQIFQFNLHQQFPKNLFIGINFIFNKQTIPLLYNIIYARDILSHLEIESPISDFTIYSKPLDDRNFPEELIDEISSAISSKVNLLDKIEILKKYIGGEIKLAENISIALSEENPFQSQLLSELKKINQDKLVLPKSLLESFLRKTNIESKVRKIDEAEFIQITPLNKNQKEAIVTSFNQPLTVITGPPGTGKTQVVLNILANAVIQNKKVLLASKNNQAVDNVKERLSKLLKEPNYFLRFGSKNDVRDKTKPIIYSFVTRIHNNIIENNSNNINIILNSISDYKKAIVELNKLIERRRILLNEIPELILGIRQKEVELNNYLVLENTNKIKAFKSASKVIIENIIKQINVTKKEIANNKYGLRSVYYKLFNKTKLINNYNKIYESLPAELLILADQHNLNNKNNNLNKLNEIESAYNNLYHYLEKGVLEITKINNSEASIAKLMYYLKEIQNEESTLATEETNTLNKIQINQTNIDNLGSDYLNELIHHTIRVGDANEINKFKDYIPDNIPWQSNENSKFIQTTKAFLDTFYICSITSLSIKNSFPLTENLFDIVVIDEASQCDIASAIPLILRAKQLVVIGDPMQLKHITKVQNYEEKYISNTLALDPNMRLNYTTESLYDYCYNLSIISKCQSIFLKEHFRCHPDIIGFSNKVFYGPKMGQELIVLTDKSKYNNEPSGIFWLNTVGKQEVEKNINFTEISKSVDLACNLASKHPSLTIGITTPFTNQAKEISQSIPEEYRDKIKADTVHRFQGDEKDIMIISLVISDNSPRFKSEWINNKVPYLINVAVSRAKNSVFIIGNANYCNSLAADSPLYQLVKYVHQLNPIKDFKIQ